MPKLTIDNQDITVAPGTKVIEAAERLGIMIPRFCFHPALGSVGACRVCAVKVVEGSAKGLKMSCMIDAEEGMVVSTTDPETVAFRKSVIEWLMMNHPHDCPVCDEGGHCLLQDTTVSGGHGRRRITGKKRTHRDQYLGPLVQHEMNRCIQCYRCTRYYREFAGYPDLGVMGIGSRVFFGRLEEGTLESPFAGNLVDICPTGVYTDKPSRFKGRRWDFERTDGVCIHCSLGCRTVVSARYREIVRHEARHSPAINGHFICDRGRYGFYYSGTAHRPRFGRVDGEEASVETVLSAAAERIREITDRAGPGAVAVAGSARCSMETLASLYRLCSGGGWHEPAVFPERRTAENARIAAAGLTPETAVSLQEISSADVVLVVGADPVNEAPMLALSLRQAHRSGGRIAVIDPRPVALPFPFQHVAVSPAETDRFLRALTRSVVSRNAEIAPGPESEAFSTVSGILKDARRPVIVCGTAAAETPAVRMAVSLARLLKAEKEGAGLFVLMPGANAFGAALISGEPHTIERIVADIETGTVRGLILVECDPFWNFPDRKRLSQALGRLELLVAADYLNTPAVRAADLFLPTATVYEGCGMFINQEARAQKTGPAFRGGLPVMETGGGDHPPRTFGREIPGGEALPARTAVAGLEHRLFGTDVPAETSDPLRWLADNRQGFENLPSIDELPDEGMRIFGPDPATDRFRLSEEPAEPERPEGSLALFLVDRTFGTEELSRYSPCLQEREAAPFLMVQSADASALGLSAGDTAVVETDTGSVQLPVAVKENMASGVLVIPRHRRIPWQELGAGPIYITKDRIRKVSDPSDYSRK